jgi:hypothetical protein
MRVHILSLFKIEFISFILSLINLKIKEIKQIEMVKLAFKPTDQVEITSKVSKKVELNLKSDKTAIDLSKSGFLKAFISSTDTKFDMYQKSSAEIEGDIVNLKLRLDNNTDFTGNKLTTKNAILETSGYSKSNLYY